MTATNPSHVDAEQKEIARRARKPMLAASMGTFIEFFDYASYSYLATTIAVVFFPSNTGAVATLQVFALFAVSFAMRPIGALFWGHFGDKIGRKRTLTLTIIGIGIATTLIGVLPGHDQIGLFAPLLLVILRLFQSFCTAGEYSGAAVMIAEFAPVAKRARYISAIPISTASGFLAASLLVTGLYGWLDGETMAAWGWRVPFLLAAPMMGIAVFLRTHIDETPVFKEAVDTGTISLTPTRDIFVQHWRPLVRTILIMGINAAGYYLVLGYMATYLEVSVGFSAFQANAIMTVALFVYLPMLYIGAVCADKFGRKPVLLASGIGFLVLSIPIFLLLGPAGFFTAMLIQLLFVFIFSLNDSTFPTFFSESFPANVRYSGFALPFNLGVAIFGGTAPFVADWLIAATGDTIMPAYVVMFVALLGTVALFMSKESSPLKQRQIKDA